MSPGAGRDNEPRVWLLAEGAFRHLRASADKGRFKKSLSMSGEVGSLVGDFRMSDPDRLSSHDKAFDRDTPGLILRIIVRSSGIR
jgi:hypothetical protein